MTRTELSPLPLRERGAPERRPRGPRTRGSASGGNAGDREFKAGRLHPAAGSHPQLCCGPCSALRGRRERGGLIPSILVALTLLLPLQGCVGFVVGTAVDATIAVAKAPFKVGGAIIDIATGDDDKDAKK